MQADTGSQQTELTPSAVTPPTNASPAVTLTQTPPQDQSPPVVSMQPPPRAAASTPAQAPAIAASANLTGSDKHLIHKPFDIQPAHDFTIGLLAERADISADEAALLSAIRDSLLDNKLPAQHLAPELQMVSDLIYGSALSKAGKISDVRFAKTVAQKGNTKLVQARLIGNNFRARALLIIGPGEPGWQIEHLSIDDLALESGYIIPVNFDPHGVLQ
jgi:hypothetical protein